MKKLIALILSILLLTGCTAAYDGPTESAWVVTEWAEEHYYTFLDTMEVLSSQRIVCAYDIYGNPVRYMKYQDNELQSVTKLKYDDRGNCIREVSWDHSGLIALPDSRIIRTYDDQNRQTSCVTYNFWGRQESGTWYTYDDEARTQTRKTDSGDSQITWFDENGNEIRVVSGEYESIYRYDDRGNYICKELFKNGQPIQRYEARYDEQNRQIGYGWYDSDGNLTFQSESLYDELGRKTGIVEYEDGTLVTTTELRYDDQNRKIWGETHDADGRLTNHWEYIYDDSAHSKTCISGDSITSVEYYHPSGQIEKQENYDRDGNLTSRSVYTYTEIQIPAKEE